MLEGIRSRIEVACGKANPARDPEEIRLVAVTKRLPVEAMQEAFDCGIRDFGENYVQEAEGKKRQLEGAGECTWHLIGPLQSNKAAQAARTFDWIHSIDRAKIAKRIGRERVSAGLGDMQACVQVNIGAEQSKSGVDPADAPKVIEQAIAVDGIEPRGLMCIPEASADPAITRERFSELSGILAKCRTRHPGLDTLSMGMSGDFEEAIMEGATIVRIGTALMGQRP